MHMKSSKLIITGLFLIASLSCKSQLENNEFKIHDNGLIYSPTTMSQLTYIVDSLNLKFKRCDLSRVYYAKSQGLGHYISMEKGNIKGALVDIKNNIKFEEFVKKYKQAKIDYNLLILKSKYQDYYSNDWKIEFSGQSLKEYSEPEIQVEKEVKYTNSLLGQWIIKHYPKNKYSEESLDAFYITSEFETPKIPEKYARMILYSDCVIDTTSDIFLEKVSDNEKNYETHEKNYKKSSLFTFDAFIEKSTKHITEKDVPSSYKDYKWFALDSMRNAYIDENIAKTEKFKQLLTAALIDVKQGKLSWEEKFEDYVAKYISKEDALELKRSRRVVGGCSQDQSPRYHALNIALLSAETVNWQVFLRAHLNIMNDRFERMSDGSYAWGARNTYIKELEELNIEVQELLLGITFRIENPVEKHYYGSISRLGRALAETKNRIQLENQLISIIKDEDLDAYNRLLIHYLYLNYIYHIKDETTRLISFEKLEEADKSLPDYIKSRIKIKKEDFLRQGD